MDYKHCRCGCGGIIGQYSKTKGFTCEKCNKEYQLSELNFDWIASGGKETDPYIQRQIDYLKAVEKAALDEKNIV